MENPSYLSCCWCPAQTLPAKLQPAIEFTMYVCPAGHRSYIEAGDTSFDYGYNVEVHAC